MKEKSLAVVFLCGGSIAGCVWPGPVPRAPGAEQVKITRNPADVAPCRAVGNLDSHIEGNTAQIAAQMQNQAVGVGGKAVLDTSVLGTTTTGVIYHCG